MPPSLLMPSRRRFVRGFARGVAALGAAWMCPSWSVQPSGQGSPVLEGTDFDLVIGETAVNFTGRPRMATTVNGSLPGPTLRWKEGSTVTLRVTNRLNVSSSIHWHGILLPNAMDGVPGMTFPGIPPGASFTYRFQVRQSGTYWYHAHSGFQEQTGLFGAIVVEPASETIRPDRDYVVQLSDWSDEDPMVVLAKLKIQSDYYNNGRPTAADFLRDVSGKGVSAALEARRMWQEMRMNPTDFADVSGATYTYLMNGATPAANWTGLFQPGERVRLRFINAGTASFFDVRIPGLKLTVIASDGQMVEPVTVDEFRISPGETYDVMVSPGDAAYTVFAQSMDRSGYARGTLAPRPGMSAEVPRPDAMEGLTMTDMMGDMEGMGGMGAMSGMVEMGSMSHAGMNHGEMTSLAGMHPGHMAAMAGMDHDGMSMGAGRPAVRHALSEDGPGTDMRVDHPRDNLDDPGVNLRHSGRRVLTYADLVSAGVSRDRREPDREIELHLTGNMERYTWSVDGVEFARSRPIHFRHGERLRVVMVNDTMMGHPFHLHGMWQDLEAASGQFQVRKHTLTVQPAQRIAFQISADAPGRWAWHCHLLFHMAAGMMREVLVA